jgi:hypothetical protein
MERPNAMLDNLEVKLSPPGGGGLCFAADSGQKKYAGKRSK